MSLKNELQNIISGNAKVRHGENIQAAASFLKRKKGAIQDIEKAKFFKDQETAILITFIEENALWYAGVDESKYIGEGAEQKIYENPDPDYIIKLNDGIFYEFWEDYFYSLLLHNYFFPHLAYENDRVHQ